MLLCWLRRALLRTLLFPLTYGQILLLHLVVGGPGNLLEAVSTFVAFVVEVRI